MLKVGLFPNYFFPLVSPKLLPFSFGDEPSYLGESTTLQCSLSIGDMPVKFSWTLNGKPLNDIQGVAITSIGKKSSVISIDSVDEHHAGDYSCLAENRAGLANHTSTLVVKGKLCQIVTFFFLLQIKTFIQSFPESSRLILKKTLYILANTPN